MNRHNAPRTPENVRNGKTLPQQIEGDHAYRDEPPEPRPRWVTIYTITEPNGSQYETTDPDVAEKYSRAGNRVTARRDLK